jgi:hypothetical protein
MNLEKKSDPLAKSILEVELVFNPHFHSTIIRGLGLEIFSRFFNFSDGSWHAYIDGPSYDHLTLISTPHPLDLPLFPYDQFRSAHVSSCIENFAFKQITQQALQTWGFKDPWCDPEDYEPYDTMGWEDIPEDPAFKILNIYDNDSITFNSYDELLLKQLAIFVINECAFFLHQQKDKCLSAQSLDPILAVLTSPQSSSQSVFLKVDKQQSVLTYSFTVQSKSWLKRFFHIRDTVTKEII